MKVIFFGPSNLSFFFLADFFFFLGGGGWGGGGELHHSESKSLGLCFIYVWEAQA